jgi:hypothetical protein
VNPGSFVNIAKAVFADFGKILYAYGQTSPHGLSIGRGSGKVKEKALPIIHLLIPLTGAHCES